MNNKYKKNSKKLSYITKNKLKYKLKYKKIKKIKNYY